MLRTSASLSIVLVSAIVRCGTIALDNKSTSGYLDCSWDTLDVEKYHDNPNGHYWRIKWACSDARLAAWLNQTQGRPTIACIGDSNTRGIGLAKKWRHAFPARLYGHHLLSRRYKVVNLGIAGTAAQRNHGGHANYWSSPHWKQVLPVLSDVAIVLVQLGTNDARDGIWKRTAFRDDYIMMLQNITEMHPNATIITSIPPPVGKVASEMPGGYAYVNNQLGEEIVTATNMAHLSAPRTNINMQPVFTGHEAAVLKDVAAVGEQPKQHKMPRLVSKSLLQGDGVHASQAGHELMADTLAALISSLAEAAS